jgi:hypothetical protein
LLHGEVSIPSSIFRTWSFSFHTMTVSTIFTTKPAIKAIPNLSFPILRPRPALRSGSLLDAEVVELVWIDVLEGLAIVSLGGSTVVRLVRVIVGKGLVVAVRLLKGVELTLPIDEFRAEEGVMIVVRSLDIVTNGLAEVMPGGGITVNEASGLVIVAAGLPELIMVRPLLVLLILLKLETTIGGGTVVEQWYVVPSTGVNEEPQQDMVTVMVGVVTVVVVVVKFAEAEGGLSKASGESRDPRV